MVTDLLGGQIDFAVLALPSVQQHIKSGALKAVGMCGCTMKSMEELAMDYDHCLNDLHNSTPRVFGAQATPSWQEP